MIAIDPRARSPGARSVDLPGRQCPGHAAARRARDHRRPGLGVVRRAGRRLRRLQGPGRRGAAGRHAATGRATARRPAAAAGSGTRPARPSTRAGTCWSCPRTAPRSRATPTTTPTRSLELDGDGKLVDSFAPTDWAAEQPGRRRPRLAGRGAGRHEVGGARRQVRPGLRPAAGRPRRHRRRRSTSRTSASRSAARRSTATSSTCPCTDGVRAVRVDGAGHAARAVARRPAVTGSPVIGGGRVWALDQPAACCTRSTRHRAERRPGRRRRDEPFRDARALRPRRDRPHAHRHRRRPHLLANARRCPATLPEGRRG